MTVEILLIHGKEVRLLLRCLVCLVTIWPFLNRSLYAQGAEAAIQGTITDSTGGVIVGATITATNQETGLQRTVTSSGSGSYVISNLPPATYRVQVSMTGFQTALLENIGLSVGQQMVLNPTLQVGEITQQVTVTSGAPLVDTSTAQISGLVAERQIKDLPLNGRSFDNLITLNPATVNSTAIKQGTSSTSGPGNFFSIAGRRPGENIFLWNGVIYPGGASSASSSPGGVSGQLLGIDAVREFNVVSNADSAEYGHRAGGQITVITASGTNSLHGSLFEFLRNSALDARNFFDRQANPTDPRLPGFKRNQFGAAAGGPMKKDQTFVFGNYEGFRQRLGLSSVAVVPDAQAREGRLPDAQGVFQPVAGFNPAVKPYFGLFPAPNGPELLVNGLPTGTALSFNNPGNPIREDFGVARIDHILSSKDSFNAGYTVDDGTSTAVADNPFTLNLVIERVQVATLSEMHIFSPNVVNSFTAGFSRNSFLLSQPSAVSPLGTQPFVAGQPLGQIIIGGGNNAAAIVRAGSGQAQTSEITNLFTYQDQLHISKGIHSMTAGTWFERLQNNESNFNFGIVTFPDLRRFLLGQPSLFSAISQSVEVPWRAWLGAWFVQDSMKLRPNLTVNLGFRHEFTNGWNADLHRAGNFIPDANGILMTQQRIGSSVFTKNNGRKLFGPRAGLAWDPFGKGKTSVRAGFGMLYSLLDAIGSCCRSLLPEAAAFQASNPPFPLQVQPGVPFPPELNGRRGGNSGGIQADARTPTVLNYRLEVEQALGGNMTIRLAYIGSHGYHDLQRADANTVVPDICGTASSSCPAALPAGTIFFPAGRPKRNPNLGSITQVFSSGVNNFNGFLVDLNRRFRAGLTFRANYTYAKSLDNASSLSGNQAVSNPSAVMDPDNRDLDYGLSAFDIRNRFSLSSSYELPFGPGKTLLNGITGAGGKLVSGWQLNAILSLQSGFPFTPTLGFNQSRNGNTSFPSDRPNFTAGRTLSGVYLRKPDQWFDPAAFSLPLAGTFGNAGRNILIGPGLKSLDLSVFKTTRLSERWNMQFRAEFFNLPNHANFGIPGTVVLTASGAPASSAGVVTRTATTSRQIQFGLKLAF